MGNYYFLAPSLPELQFGHKPEVSFEEVKNRLAINLNKADAAKADVFSRLIDIENIRSLLLGQPLDPRGSLSEKELDEALLIRDVLPEYVFDFLDQFSEISEKIRHFSGLISRFFAEEIPKAEGFLLSYLVFERNWRLVLTALRAKALKRDLLKELQFEDLNSFLVLQILAQKDAEHYEPPEEFAELKELFVRCGENPLEQYLSFAKWRLSHIEEMVAKPLFSMDWILSYLARLLIVEDANALDQGKGKTIMHTLGVFSK